MGAQVFTTLFYVVPKKTRYMAIDWLVNQSHSSKAKAAIY